MTDWRLEAFMHWKSMEEPDWANVNYKKPNFQDISYYSAPNSKPKYESIDEVDPELLDTFNLHTILDMPGGTFIGAGVKTVVLFFTKGEPTKNIWYYQPNIERNMGKTNPLNEKDLADFIALQKTKAESENSRNVRLSDVDQTTFDLSAKNPNIPEEAPLRQPNEILEAMATLDKETADVMNDLKLLIGND